MVAADVVTAVLKPLIGDGLLPLRATKNNTACMFYQNREK
jgi:hypothetical protein